MDGKIRLMYSQNIRICFVLIYDHCEQNTFIYERDGIQ